MVCILTDSYKNIRVNKSFVIIKLKFSFKNSPLYNFTLKTFALNNKSNLNFSAVRSYALPENGNYI